MLEQERIANEEAEKRLKAALTAKREPNAAVSRMASPAIGNSGTPDVESKPLPSAEADISMDVDVVSATPPMEGVSKLMPLCFHQSSSIYRAHGCPSYRPSSKT